MADNTTLPGTGDVIAADQQLDGSKVQRFNINDLSFVERVALKMLTKITFSMTGLRVDLQGQTLGNVGTVSAITTAGAVALGRNSTDGQGVQQSQQAFQSGFRRNLVVS